MDKEYIEREAFKQHIQAISHSPNDQFSASSVINLINKAPAVDVAPVVHGRWFWKNRHRGGFQTYTGVDSVGEQHTITVDGRFEICEP